MSGIAFITMLHLARIYDMFQATNKTKSYIPPVHYLKEIKHVIEDYLNYDNQT